MTTATKTCACGCDRPMDGKSRSARFATDNCRKRHHERAHAGRCACGQPLSCPAVKTCVECAKADNAARVRNQWHPRMREVERLWNAGVSLAEIARALGMTRGAANRLVCTMRRDGWDIPYRHRGVWIERAERRLVAASTSEGGR